jgi:hypothetical protein
MAHEELTHLVEKPKMKIPKEKIISIGDYYRIISLKMKPEQRKQKQ